VGPAVVGVTYTSWKDGWWIGFEGTNTSPHIDEYLAEHPESQSSWFELSNTETWIGVDVAMPVVRDLVYARAEVARYGFESLWDVGNQEKVEGETYSNGAIDVPVGDVMGGAFRVVLESSPMPTVDLRFEGTMLTVEGMEEGELYVSFDTPHWRSDMTGQFTEVTGTGSPLVAGIYGPAPERSEVGFEFDAGMGFGIFDLGLEVDFYGYEWTYLSGVPGTDGGSDVWEQGTSRIAAGFDASVSERIDVGLALENRSLNYEDDDFDSPSTLEAIVDARVGLWEQWDLLLDVRGISYTDFTRTAADTSTYVDEDNFIAPYVALVYSPRENVEIRVGYGVNPVQYTDTPVEGRANGRERWMSEYLWEHSLHDMMDAEEALSDARTIGVMAVLTF
jgi:hypothetical protein